MSENNNSTKKLTNDEREELLEIVENNDLESFNNFIFGDGRRLPDIMFEDISEEGYNWNVFHYAMYYGKWEIIQYIFEYLFDSNLIEKALKMKTKNNNCPLLSLLKSNAIDYEQKKDIFNKIINTYPITINDEVLKEADKKNIYKKNESNIKNELPKEALEKTDKTNNIDNDNDNDNNIIKNELSIDEKMDFYNSVKEGNLELFKSYLNGTPNRKPYDIFEEVSEHGYHWTVFHYAMHYGKWDIIKYIVEYLKNLNLLDFALKNKSTDNRCPLLCLLKSNAINNEQKKNIYFKLINNYNIPISDEVLEEAIERNFYENKNDKYESIFKNEYNFKDESIGTVLLKGFVKGVLNLIFDDNDKYNNKNNNNHNYNNNGNNNINKSLLKNELSTDEKEAFFLSVIDGNLDLFKSYIYGTPNRKPYDIFEEISVPGLNWSVFHYAMHYGKWEIIKFIFEYLINLNKLNYALNIKTNDGRCPLLCLLRSKDLKSENKRNIFIKIIENFHIPISREVRKELNERNMDDLLMIYNYN